MYEKEGNQHPETQTEADELDGLPSLTREEALDKLSYHKTMVEYYEQRLKEMEEREL